MWLEPAHLNSPDGRPDFYLRLFHFHPAYDDLSTRPERRAPDVPSKRHRYEVERSTDARQLRQLVRVLER